MSFQKPTFEPVGRGHGKSTMDHLSKGAPPAKWTQPRIARVTYYGHTANCSCGWNFSHKREKIREDRIDAHLDKRHAGRGIRL